jgi:hypothetical protein
VSHIIPSLKPVRIAYVDKPVFTRNKKKKKKNVSLRHEFDPYITELTFCSVCLPLDIAEAEDAKYTVRLSRGHIHSLGT